MGYAVKGEGGEGGRSAISGEAWRRVERACRQEEKLAKAEGCAISGKA
jgi:hypothetical protein